jgi:hypothetical protein
MKLAELWGSRQGWFSMGEAAQGSPLRYQLEGCGCHEE